jgi:hypothetical protein
MSEKVSTKLALSPEAQIAQAEVMDILVLSGMADKYHQAASHNLKYASKILQRLTNYEDRRLINLIFVEPSQIALGAELPIAIDGFEDVYSPEDGTMYDMVKVDPTCGTICEGERIRVGQLAGDGQYVPSDDPPGFTAHDVQLVEWLYETQKAAGFIPTSRG